MWLHRTFVTVGKTGTYQVASLRGFLYEHPRIGLDTKRDRWYLLESYIQQPRPEDDPKELAQNPTTLRMCLRSTPGRSRSRLDAFIDLWAPWGPLSTTREDWEAIPEFMEWFTAGGKDS